jgi:putative tricarboxylic transport membrane protein
MAAIASFIAGTFGVVALMLVAPPLAQLSLAFSAPEYFALMVLGLTMVVLLAGESLTKALPRDVVGCGSPAWAPTSSPPPRASPSGASSSSAASTFIIVAIGVFAIGEVIGNMEPEKPAEMLPVPRACETCCPTWEDMKRCRFAFVNGSVVGFLIGVLPGAGSTIAVVPELRHREGRLEAPGGVRPGRDRGRGAPEGANNAETGGALVPLLTLGIPGSGTTAILLAALVSVGIQAGRSSSRTARSSSGASVASMYIGNVLLLVLNLPLVAVFAQLLKVPATRCTR